MKNERIMGRDAGAVPPDDARGARRDASGDPADSDGDERRTPRDKRRWFDPRDRFGFYVIVALSVALVPVNATSVIMERARDGDPIAPWEPFLWESSSLIALLMLLPLVAYGVHALAPNRIGWPKSLAAHAALTLPFSAFHVAAMVFIRKAAYTAVGDRYVFGPMLTEFLYEYRKDAVSYLFFVGILVFARSWTAPPGAAAAPASEGPARIALKDGGRTVLTDAHAVLRLKAAGNYVEVILSDRVLTVRGGLDEVAAAFPPQTMLRVHRSHAVNPARVREIAPTGHGDARLTLSDGETVPASRRYRDAWDPLRKHGN